MAIRKHRRANKSVKPSVGHSLEVSIAMLQTQQEQTSERFATLGDKFDRILSRVEELALHTTSLNSRHDTEIQVLQKQIAASEILLTQTREDINSMNTKLTELVSKELSDAITQMSGSIAQLSEKMELQKTNLESRVQKLEQWRTLMIGGGLVIGFILSRIADNFFNYFLTTTHK